VRIKLYFLNLVNISKIILERLIFKTDLRNPLFIEISVKLKLKVSISPTCLRQAFACADSKSLKIHSSCQYLFVLWGSTCVKAAPKILMKLSPNVFFPKQ
jgi:hypothetical protein